MPVKKSSDVAHEARQRPKISLPKPVRQPVQQHRVKTRIGKRDLPHRPRRRIALENNLDIFFNVLPHAEQTLGDIGSVGVLRIWVEIIQTHYSIVPPLH